MTKSSEIQGYFFDLSLKKFLKCDEKCFTCEEKFNDCLECDFSKGYYKFENNSEKNSTLSNIKNKKTFKCYNNCPKNYLKNELEKSCKNIF